MPLSQLYEMIRTPVAVTLALPVLLIHHKSEYLEKSFVSLLSRM